MPGFRYIPKEPRRPAAPPPEKTPQDLHNELMAALAKFLASPFEITVQPAPAAQVTVNVPESPAPQVVVNVPEHRPEARTLVRDQTGKIVGSKPA